MQNETYAELGVVFLRKGNKSGASMPLQMELSLQL